jgi:hypothetical protein
MELITIQTLARKISDLRWHANRLARNSENTCETQVLNDVHIKLCEIENKLISQLLNSESIDEELEEIEVETTSSNKPHSVG